MLRKGRLGVRVEVDAWSSGAAAKGPAAAAPSASGSGVGVIVAVVGGRHCVVCLKFLSVRSGGVEYWNIVSSIYVMICVASSGYIFYVAVCGTVGVGHRSRGGWGLGVVGFRGGGFVVDFRNVRWGRSMIPRYVMAFYRVGYAKFKFQVGLVVGVH